MSDTTTIESALSALRLDIDDQVSLSASCEEHALCESNIRAMIDAFRPLTDAFEVYVTRQG